MSTLHSSALPRSSAVWPAFAQRLGAECLALMDALMNPGRIVAEVEQMRVLQAQADRIEATDPAAALALRQRASRIGLR